MEHRSILMDDDVLEGAWWKGHALLPVCTWSYDRATRSLRTQRGSWLRTVDGIPPWIALSDQELVDRLSHIALAAIKESKRT